MPATSVARRTPFGILTLTMPLCRKNKDDAGSPGPDDALSGLICSRLHKRRKRFNLAIRQTPEQLLLGQRGRIVQPPISAITIDDLVFGPLDRFIEHRELSQFRRRFDSNLSIAATEQ